MGRGFPEASELLRYVARHLESVVQPALSGADAYQNRVAANVLGIVRRELAAATQSLDAEHERLCLLLHSSGTVDELNAELCARIRTRALCAGHPELMRHLRLTTTDAIAVDNPGYSAYERVK